MAGNLQQIKLVHNKKYKPSGIKSYVWLMHKYKFSPTQEGPYFISNKIQHQGKFGALGGKARVRQGVIQKKGDGTTQPGEIDAEDVQNDALYLCPTLKLDFDTGSADLWVWSTKLPEDVQSKGKSAHVIFDPSKSSSFKQMDSTWKIQYGDQSSASGSVGTDNIDLGGLVVESQGIELADTLSAQFQEGTGDGLLGLAFGSINTVQPDPVATPVENMIKQDDIKKGSELFTAYLGSWRDADEEDKGQSFYTFGYIDQDTVSASGEEIYYTPVDNSQGFWQFESAFMTVNGRSVATTGNTAIADTGTTLALVSDDVCKAIYDAIPGAEYDSRNQGWVFPSNTTADKLPTVTFAVGEKQFAVQKEDLGFADAGNNMVYGGIQSRGDLNFDILGDTFLKGIYAIFDQGNKKFGAVQRKETNENTSQPPQ
ncbi:aspartic proteinase precursor [Aulographum hederae CBS 113979]|uniref:Aspartic proteinase n=1 Tax=Aulographum hederae CBS 113979 TaxID=1176131 RepID=A0A6G1GZN3_9PEZI|nr:aspartic proteinase precursor [Aulographum hederae CBS 113979]